MDNNYDKLIIELKALASTFKEDEQKMCPYCRNVLIKRVSKFGFNKYWYGCSNYPRCKFTCSGKDFNELSCIKPYSKKGN